MEAECVPLVETSSPVRPVIRTPRTSLWPVSPISTSGQPQPCQPAMVIEEAENEVSRESGVRNRSVDVSIKVNWPSKPNREHKLPEDLESLGKMLACGTYKQIANSAWKNENLKSELIQLVRKDIEKECCELCSKKNPSCLRKTSKDDLLSFGMEQLTEEIKDRAPIFYSVLSAAAINRKSKAKNPSPQAEVGAIGMAAAVCLRNRSQYIIAVQLLITVFLYHSNWLVSSEYIKKIILSSVIFFLK